MEKYVKLKDVYNLLMTMYEEPRFRHEGEDYHSGVSQVASNLSDLATIELEEPKEATKGLHLGHQYYCSNCGELTYMHKYCASCGAKVKESVE